MPRRNDPIPPATYVQVWDEPSEADRSLMREIMSHGPVVGGMHLAWSMTLRDGLERGFWIYRPAAGRLAIGKMWTGTQTALDPRAFYERLVLGPSLASVVANYHSHPGRYWLAAFPSYKDDRYNRASSTMGILQTRFGFSFGRTSQQQWRKGW